MAQEVVFTGFPAVPEEPTPAEWARISHEMGMNCEATESVIKELAEMFRFRGMDPAAIIKKFAKIGKEAHRNWLKDAVYLIILHVCRGTKFSKIKKSVSPEAAAEIETLVTTYHLKEGKPVGDEITLARIALCFPLLTLRQVGLFKEHLTVKLHHMQELSPGYPVHMMHSAFASLICDQLGPEAVADLLDAHRLYLLELTKVINPPMRTKPVAEIAESFEQPLQAGNRKSACVSRFRTRHRR